MIKDPLILTIFGATGNLTYNKLMPALYQLFVEDRLNEDISIVTIGRSVNKQEQYLDKVEADIKKNNNLFSKELFDQFKMFITYYKMDFVNEEEFKKYGEFIDTLDQGDHGNRIYYLATAPKYFGYISKNLRK